MSGLPVETTEPDPAATSLSNDQSVKAGGVDVSAPTDATAEATNGANRTTESKDEVKQDIKADVKDEIKEETSKENGISAEKKNGESVKKLRTYENGVLKTSAQQIEGKNNSRYDPSVLPTTDDPVQIRAQVEFYFGDANLPTDNYMYKKTGGPENIPVLIEDICSFGRMKRFQPYSAVVAALKASKFLEVVGEEGHEKVKRRYPFDPAAKSKSEARSVYVKGFGDEDPSSQFDIEAFFAPYGPINSVRLRRTEEKLFKGSVFVEFEDEELAKKFLGLDPKPLWKGAHKLEIQTKTEYMEKKNQDIRDGKIEPGVQREAFRGRGRGNNRGRGEFRNGGDRRDRGDRSDRKGDRDPNDWKKRREDDRASGFKDDRKSGRGGRGNNRGGRGRRDDRGPRNNDRNREREERKDSKSDGKDANKSASDEKPAEVKVESPKNQKKRSREDEDGGEQTPAKKMNIKAESPENKKKRSREDEDGGEQAPAKKMDIKVDVTTES